MTTIATNNSSSVMNTEWLMQYLPDSTAPLNDLLNDPSESIFYEVGTEIAQEDPYKDFTYCLNPVQNPTEKAYSKPSLPILTAEVEKTKIKQSSNTLPSEWLVPRKSKKELADGITRITKRLLKRAYKHYAHALQVDPQDIKNIYSAVCQHCPTALKPSKIKIKQSSNTLPSAWLVPRKSKKELADGITRIKKRLLEKAYKHYAHALQVDPQDIKNIYSAVCYHCPTALKTSKIKTIIFNNFS